MMLYLIRHGQTDQNKEKRLQGRSNAPLNAAGREEAEHARAFFREQGIAFDRCYSSPLRRAMETAEIVTGFDAPEIVTTDLLLEMDYGPYEGTGLENPPAEITEFFSDFVHNPAPDGMEALPHVVERLGIFLRKLLEETDAGASDNVLISTHAIAMKGALEYLTENSKGAYWSRYIGNCSVYAFERKDGQFTVPVEFYGSCQ